MPEKKEYIERGALIKKLNDKSINAQTVFINTVLKGLLYQAPVADVVEVVRCKNCTFSTSLPLSDVVYEEISDESRFNLIDELADVVIMTEQIAYLADVRSEVLERIDFKINRQLERIVAEVNDEHSDN